MLGEINPKIKIVQFDISSITILTTISDKSFN